MFLPWSILSLDAFFLLLEFLVIISFEAALAYISRHFEGYSHSIRWIQQAGKWEAITALRMSKGLKAKRSWAALSATLAMSIALLVILTGVKSFAKQTVAERNPSHELVASKQVITGHRVPTLAGWSFYIPYNMRMEEALTMMVNSSRSIPRAAPTKRYRPSFSNYESVCDQYDIRAPNRDFLVLPNDGCAFIVLAMSDIFTRTNLTRMYTVRKSQERATVVIPTQTFQEYREGLANMVSGIGVVARVNYLDEMCLTPNLHMALFNATHAGMTTPPVTVVTKCLFTSGASVILSNTAIHFAVPSGEMFHSVATSIFGTQDELVLSMEDTVNNRTLTTLPPNVLEILIVTEVKLTGNDLSALICEWARETVAEVPHIVCTYTVTNALIIKPEPMNPSITRRLVNRGLNPSWSNVTVTATLRHLPQESDDSLSFDIPKILKASAATTEFFASFGNNFVVDWEGGMLYIAFETVEFVKGYEIPHWLFFSIIGVMIVCLLFSGTTWLSIDARYRDSLYMTVCRELTFGRNDEKPRLHPFDPKTLKFESGRRLVVSKSLPQASVDDMVYEGSTVADSQDPTRV